METVLVTGGTGFIGLHCLQQLLDKGYKVRTTLRSESRKQEVMEAMKKHSSNCENLEFFIADLLNDDGWKEAVEGSKYVLHVASPFFLGEPENEDVFIKPAVEGTLRVLKACADSEVQKVVLTSSFAAVGYGHPREKEVYTEEDWSSVDGEISPYAKSKTLAEKAAWDFVENLEESKKFELTVINPVAVTGPMLTSDIGSSNDFLLKLISGSMPACPKIHMGYIDVRDVAKAHIFSMTEEKTNGERIIVSENEMFFAEVGKTLNEAGFKKSPTKEMPNFLVKIMSLFVGELKTLLSALNRKGDIDKTKAKSFFNWDYISTEQSVTETAQQLQDMGLIK
jgi:dihydroflavonol-4-reductase|tara:strand:- start:4725 stop:5738 length:1014 start_codon:yes stop_codon:yes gene_type:complete